MACKALRIGVRSGAAVSEDVYVSSPGKPMVGCVGHRRRRGAANVVGIDGRSTCLESQSTETDVQP